VDVSWTKLTDLSTHEGKLLGASCSNSFVGVWVVDLARCEPFHSGKDVGPGGGGTRDAPDRRGEFDENRPPPTHSGRAEEAVAAAALAAKARVEASEDRAREASARPSHLTSEPRGSAPGSSARVELNDGAGAQSRMEMNTGFAAAHGIGADPMADKPPTVVYANPKPTTPLTRALNLAVPGGAETRAVNEDSGRPESRDQSDWETDLGDGDESDADEVIEEDIPTPEPEPDVIVSPPGGLHDSMELRRSMPPPTIEVHESPAQSPSPSPVKAQVSAATRQSRERKRYVHTATGMGSSRAFDLDVLRSAALEATSEFVVNESGAGANEETNTLGT
jgi:katanin p80 WD40 repeat-containing subunit B1